MKGVPKYIKDHGVDPSPLLCTPWMSEEVSECSLDDEVAYNENMEKRKSGAGYTDQELEDGKKILEHVSMSWKSKQVRLLNPDYYYAG